MAQPTVCPYALSRLVLRQARLRSRNHTRRAFSLSARHQKGTIPQYNDPSSESLNPTLAALRYKVFLPHALNSDQQDLVFNPSNRSRLVHDEIYVQLGDEEILLEPLKWAELPNRGKLLKQLIEEARTQDDWENVVKTLVAMGEAGLQVKREWKEKFIRKAGEAGMMHLVVRAVLQVKDTGLSLSEPTILRSVMLGLREKAQAKDQSKEEGGEDGPIWGKEATRKALTLTEQVIEAMESPLHCGGRGTKDAAKGIDGRSMPFVVATLLEITAANAVRYSEGKDTNGRVKRYAERLMGCLEQGKKDSFPGAELDRNVILERVPILHALTLSQRILSEGMPQLEQAQSVIAALEADVVPAVKRLEAKSPEDGSYDSAALTAWRNCIR